MPPTGRVKPSAMSRETLESKLLSDFAEWKGQTGPISDAGKIRRTPPTSGSFPWAKRAFRAFSGS